MKAMDLAIRRPARHGDLEAVERAADGFRSEDGLGIAAEGLGVELGHPPVVFAGRVGGNVGHAFRVGRPVELVRVQVGGGDERGLGGRSGVGGGIGDALDFNGVVADDSGPRLHGCERAGGAGCSCDIEERDLGAIRRKRGLVHVAFEGSELLCGAAVRAGEIEITLAVSAGAVREERQGL